MEARFARVVSASTLLVGICLALPNSTAQAAAGYKTANFVGEWVPTILMLGLYNKIAKATGGRNLNWRSGSAFSHLCAISRQIL